MGDSDDFTFCQVAPQFDDSHLESHRTISNIKDITIEDNSSNVVGVHKADSVHDRSPHDAMELGSARSSSDTSNDMPPELKLKEPPIQNAGETKSPPVVSKEEKRTVKKPIVRAKVPFEKGYSQMDWLKLTRTHPDLAGLKGQSNRRPISMDEVRLHKSEGSIWTVLKGRVYNISPYMKFHPGGVDMLMKAAGKDSTSLFNKYHAWVNDEFLLEKCLVGVLDDSKH